MNKVLFIGDLRSANNYGAIATTENLLKMIAEDVPSADIKLIDFRSLYSPTPPEGFPPYVKKPMSMWGRIKKMCPSCIKKIIKSQMKKREVNDFAPYKYSQYEEYYLSMKQGRSLQFEMKMLEWADVVYINGEGNVVNGTDKYGKYRMGARYILFMAWLSKVKFHKTTIIANHTVDPNNYNAFEMISAIYPLLDKVYVRETLSLPLLEKHGIKNAVFVPDALFSYVPQKDWKPNAGLCSQIDFTKPYICIGDSSGIANGYNKVKWDARVVFASIIEKLKEITPQIIFVDGYDRGNEDINYVVKHHCSGSVCLETCNYHDLCQVLKRAQVFISGRWHASILSTIANTPIVCWGADSHKTRSLYTLLNYPYRFFEVSTLPVNIDEMIDEVRKVIKDTPQIQLLMKNKVEQYSKETRENARVICQFLQ